VQALAKKLKLWSIGDMAIRRNPVFYEDARQVLVRLEGASMAQRRAWTQARLSEVLAVAARTPYGRELRATSQLRTWPLLTKDQVRASPRAFQSGSGWFTVKDSTGGTSGAPLPVWRSLSSIASQQACIDLMLHKLGVDARRARIAVLRTENVKPPDDLEPPFWVYAASGRRLILSSSHLNATTAVAYARALKDFAPDVLMTYPTAVESLCIHLERAGIELRVPRVHCASEVLHEQVWRQVAQRFGCTVLDQYGQAERVAHAWAMQPGDFRFVPGYAYVELEAVGAEDNQVLYEIIGTTLWNLAMPLIRYRTGDLIRVPREWGSRELEEVVLGERSFGGVLGRDRDILVTPAGTRVIGLSHFQRHVDHIVRIQIIQETLQQVRILVLAQPDYSAHDERRLLQNVRGKLPATMEVKIERATQLERTALGKTPFVIRRPAVQAALSESRLLDRSA
jgi:phenylacetate-CoA ligase